MKMSGLLVTLRAHALLAGSTAVVCGCLLVGNLAAEDSKDRSDDATAASKKSENSTTSESTAARKNESSKSEGQANDSAKSSDEATDGSDRSNTSERSSRQSAESSARRSRDDTANDESEYNQNSRNNRAQGGQNQRSQQAQGRQVQSWQQGQPGQGQQRRQQLDAQSLGLALEADDNGNLTVSRVASQGQARQAGLREDDIIVSINGRDVSSQREFNRLLSGLQGQRAVVVVERDGRDRTIYLGGNNQVARRSNSYQEPGYSRRASYDENQNGNQQFANQRQQSPAFLGVILDERYPNMAVVREVYQDSPADEAGLKAGDTITGLNGQRVRSPQELSQTVMQLGAGSDIQVQYSRPQTRNVRVHLTTREETVGRGGEERQARRQSRDDSSSERRTSSRDQANSSGEADEDSDNPDNSSEERDNQYNRG